MKSDIDYISSIFLQILVLKLVYFLYENENGNIFLYFSFCFYIQS